MNMDEKNVKIDEVSISTEPEKSTTAQQSDTVHEKADAKNKPDTPANENAADSETDKLNAQIA